MKQSVFLVTGGSGFIGSFFVLKHVARGDRVINLDRLTYSANPLNTKSIEGNPAYTFVHGDIGDESLVRSLLETHQPDCIVNFAAETHVDRSIADPDAFVRTNVVATSVLLRTVKDWWTQLPEGPTRNDFRFLHISTDEVYGTLGKGDKAFTENTPFAPNSPYSASKASGDHFVRAFHETYALPTIIINCSNNYGLRQFPEKLIPLMTLTALAGKALPVYGTGENIRDWLHVEDHIAAIDRVLTSGKTGSRYNVGGHSERTNIAVVTKICEILDELSPRDDAKSYKEQITFVADRPGHDLRYAIDCSKIERELCWTPRRSFEEGLRETVRWYLENPEWVESIRTGAYQTWLETNYAGRTSGDDAKTTGTKA